MYRVEFSEHADHEMIEISDYIYDESGSVETAIKIVSDLTNRITDRLSRFPNSGLVEFVSESGVVYRQIVVGNYYIIYRIEENKEETFVIVTNVIHHKRNKDMLIEQDYKAAK